MPHILRWLISLIFIFISFNIPNILVPFVDFRRQSYVQLCLGVSDNARLLEIALLGNRIPWLKLIMFLLLQMRGQNWILFLVVEIFLQKGTTNASLSLKKLLFLALQKKISPAEHQCCTLMIYNLLVNRSRGREMGN